MSAKRLAVARMLSCITLLGLLANCSGGGSAPRVAVVQLQMPEELKKLKEYFENLKDVSVGVEAYDDAARERLSILLEETRRYSLGIKLDKYASDWPGIKSEFESTVIPALNAYEQVVTNSIPPLKSEVARLKYLSKLREAKEVWSNWQLWVSMTIMNAGTNPVYPQS